VVVALTHKTKRAAAAGKTLPPITPLPLGLALMVVPARESPNVLMSHAKKAREKWTTKKARTASLFFGLEV
jgi:hypothetical protein